MSWQTSLTAGTVLARSGPALTTWFLLVYQLTQRKNGSSALEFERQLGAYYPPARGLKREFRRVMKEREAASEPGCLPGDVARTTRC